MRRARDSVADRSRRLPSKRTEAGPPASVDALLSDGRSESFLSRIAIVLILACGCQGQKEARRSAARTPSLLIAPESSAVLPHATSPVGLGDALLISHGAGARLRARGRVSPSPKFGKSERRATAGRRAERLRHWAQTRGERHLSAADQRAAIVLRRGSPLVPSTGYSSADTAKATPKPSVVARPTSLPPRANASGIIVSASIVRIAPAAKERTKATVRGDAPKRP